MSENIALYGGTPIRQTQMNYAKQAIYKEDIDAVVSVLKSDWLTQGPKVRELEKLLCNTFGASYTVTSTSGTSALHLACLAAGIKEDDEVITSPLTFVASANCIKYCGGTPVFADILEGTYNINPVSVESKITNKTKAIIAVDFAGQPVMLEELKSICEKHKLILIEDAAHSFGSKYKGRYVGSIADITTFSFHPVKTVTGGEGGAILTNNKEYYERMRLMATHGITKNPDEFIIADDNFGEWYYEQIDLGYNYRMTEMQAALIISQISRLDFFKEKRRKICEQYNKAFEKITGLIIPFELPQMDTCWHLYVLGINEDQMGCNRKEFFDALVAENIHPQVHYIPVYHHPYYQRLGYGNYESPVCESVYQQILSLPLYPAMTDDDVCDVINAVLKISEYFRRTRK